MHGPTCIFWANLIPFSLGQTHEKMWTPTEKCFHSSFAEGGTARQAGREQALSPARSDRRMLGTSTTPAGPRETLYQASFSPRGSPRGQVGRYAAGRNRYGVQGVHLNPLGLFLCTSILCIWSILSACLPS
jgi:hypothetical protein